ncbi:hybrid sensor histidine kinase/response regulator [Brevifollis gellanilyticus]|uniref:histidine kinase n=1 Tax=Brevifollis gellanilyticus TaxID=748831 RepID=A0A512M7H4_9BACT|nr:hybrid sensor histidine kinase/response regulator [Brevifollis gellanilyticus]GEP42692.1 hybrid sensor histidine kinase/response regulator [Brevifollis gellanilyticus]
MFIDENPTISLRTPARGVILVVDDQMRNIQVVGTILTQEGYEVIPASSGTQALQRVAARLPDLVLLDVVMPEMDGFEVCKKLREHHDTAALPVIFVSAADDADTVVRGLEAGGTDYVSKPFNRAELLARVRNQVELKRARETAARILRERENIVSMVAHDLKNPIGAIRFSAQTLAELKPEQRHTAEELMQHIVGTCDQVVELVDRFLSNRAQEASQERFYLARISSEQVRDMIASWKQTAKRKNISFDVRFKAEGQHVRVDLLILGQVIDNLLSNAVKFSPIGSHIQAELKPERGHLVVSIQDEGPGFNDSDLARMFQDYMRLSARPTGGESSTGLGLAIAKRGADRMGALLAMDNRSDGKGAVAKLELPLWSEA